MVGPIEFYFEFNSPYGYIAAHLIDDVADRHGRTVDWKPFLLGAVFAMTGAKALMDTHPLKSSYALNDMKRTARLHGVAFNMPDRHPFSPVSAARAVYWAKDRDGDAAKALTRALYAAALCDNRSIAGAARGCRHRRHGRLRPRRGGRRACRRGGQGAPQAGGRRRHRRGVFGSPFFIVDGEAFWGVDHIAQLDRWLETGGW